LDKRNRPQLRHHGVREPIMGPERGLLGHLQSPQIRVSHENQDCAWVSPVWNCLRYRAGIRPD
jgi:hypothetical protein